jgi:hypothetical protein
MAYEIGDLPLATLFPAVAHADVGFTSRFQLKR